MNKIEFLKQSISDLIKKDNKNVTEISFQERSLLKFWSKTPRVTVNVRTYNPEKGVSFLLVSIGGKNKEEVLHKAIDFIEQKSCTYSYTFEWSKSPENVSHKSFFCAKDIYEALDKFYDGNDPRSYVIFNIKLNPLS